MTERRQGRRHPKRIEVRFWIEGEPETHAGHTQNISVTGVFIQGTSNTAVINGVNFDIGGDVIIGVEGLNLESFYELQVYLTRNTRPGDTVTLTIIREGDVIDVDFILGNRPPPF